MDTPSLVGVPPVLSYREPSTLSHPMDSTAPLTPLFAPLTSLRGIGPAVAASG